MIVAGSVEDVSLWSCVGGADSVSPDATPFG